MPKDTILSNDLEKCRPWIEAALEYTGGTHYFDDIVESIAKGTMQLWAAPRGCIVTEIVIYPRKKVLNIFLAGGELEQILDMDNDVKEWASTESTMNKYRERYKEEWKAKLSEVVAKMIEKL